MFPGRASSPKNWGFSLSASLRLMSSDARPSTPTMGFDSEICKACATCSFVIRANPFACSNAQRLNFQSRGARKTTNRPLGMACHPPPRTSLQRTFSRSLLLAPRTSRTACQSPSHNKTTHFPRRHRAKRRRGRGRLTVCKFLWAKVGRPKTPSRRQEEQFVVDQSPDDASGHEVESRLALVLIRQILHIQQHTVAKFSPKSRCRGNMRNSRVYSKA